MQPAADWCADEEELLRGRYGRARTREIAATLGRSVGAVKQKAMKLGLDAGRPHKAEELAAVRNLYPTHTALEIAERLYGTAEKTNRVLKMVEKLGLKKWRFWPPEVLARVRELHADGLTDRMIADMMPGTFADGDDGRLQVRCIRVRLVLCANRGTDAAKARSRQAVRSQLAAMGIVNPNELRQRSHRRFAARYGLPEDLRPAQVRMVLALVAGPMTLPELKTAIGARPESQLLHNEAATTYQADLVNRGLAARIPTGAGGSTKGPRVRYLLTAACLNLLAAAPREDAHAAGQG